MKTIHSCAFLCFFLVGLSAQAQVNPTTPPTAGSAATNGLSAAETAALEAASNALQVATFVVLTNELVLVSPPTLSLSSPTTAPATDPSTSGATTLVIATNALQPVTVTLLQSQPWAMTSTVSPGLAAGGMSPLDAMGGCVQPPSGLVGWWRAENNALDSAGSNAGEWIGGDTYGGGEVGLAFRFNGSSQYVSLPNLATTNFTMEAWIYPNSQPSGQCFILGQSFGRQLVVEPWGSGVAVAIYITTTGGSFYGLSYYDDEIPITAWTHIAATWDSTHLVLYLNGSAKAQAAPGFSSIGDANCPFSIGASGSCAPSQYFPGLIDEMSLYSRALSANEIAAIVQAGSAGKCPPQANCTPCPASAVAWWPAEGNASDSLGAHNGTPHSVQYMQGQVGQAFSFGGSGFVETPNSGLISSSWSFEAWVKPANAFSSQVWLLGQLYGRQLLLRPGASGPKVALAVSSSPYTWQVVEGADILVGVWSHVVGVCDSSAGTLNLYVNGNAGQPVPLGLVPWDSGASWTIGAVDGQGFSGGLDEVTVYNSALSSGQVQAIYAAGAAGKCLPDPTITVQPTSQTVAPGGAVTLTVVATGTAPLKYQWFCNSGAIAGATSASLTLNNVSLFDAGTYNVVVSSIGGSAISAAATLTVSQVVAPVFSPVGGSYPSARNVVVTCSTPSAVIHYTINGQEPTQSDPTVASGSSVSVVSSLTLKAKAWRTGWTTSVAESESYRIEATPSDQPPIVAVSPPTGTSLLASDDLPILVEASDPDGTIARVQLFRDGVQVAETTASPLQYTMSQVTAGTYSFVAKAMDNAGFVTVSPATVVNVNASDPVVSLSGVQPYFTSSPGTLLASVLGVNPGGLAHLTLNGAVQTDITGSFTLSPALSQGANTFTLVATDKQSRNGQATATVYLDSLAPTISISAPANNSTFNTTRINVSGSFTETSLKRITVNGVPAFVTGSLWEALNVPLAVGANTITATAEDLAGNIGTVNIAVTGSASPVDPVQLTATPIGGFAPLQVTFQAQSSAPGTLQQVLYDFTGDDTTFQTAANLQPISHTYSSPGQFSPVVTLVTSAGRFSSTGGWNSGDPSRPRINVLAPPQQVGDAIAVTDPVDLKATADGKLYVLSRSTATIREYDTTTTPPSLIRSLSGIGTTPTGLDVDSAGNVYVANSGDNQVAKFNPTAGSFQLEACFGTAGLIGKTDKSTGNGHGEFNSPYDVAVTPDSQQIAVSDSGNDRIQSFSGSGVFIDSFGEAGSGLGQFSAPTGLSYDQDGLLYIVDSENNRISVGESPDAAETSGLPGSALGQFQAPINLSADTRGVYVADTGNGRIQVFEPPGSGGLTPLTPLGALSTELGLNLPRSVAPVEDPLEQRIYIADTGNNRVILVRLPTSGTPEDIWNSMTARLIAGDISGALQYFCSGEADRFQRAFMWIGPADLVGVMSDVGPISPIFIHHDSARYYFQQVIDGVTLGFPIEFSKENGKWVIADF